jgi:hypothetical protein
VIWLNVLHESQMADLLALYGTQVWTDIAAAGFWTGMHA